MTCKNVYKKQSNLSYHVCGDTTEGLNTLEFEIVFYTHEKIKKKIKSTGQNLSTINTDRPTELILFMRGLS